MTNRRHRLSRPPVSAALTCGLANPWVQASPRKTPRTMSWTCSWSTTAAHGASQGDLEPAEASSTSTRDGSRYPERARPRPGRANTGPRGLSRGEHVAEATEARRSTSIFPASFPRRFSKSEMRDNCSWWEVTESALERNERTSGRER